MTACGRPNATCLILASGARAGSITVLALVQPVFATPSCCRPSRRPRRRCCVRSLGRALPHGSAPSPARPAPQYRQTACSSLCGGDCACRCPSHKADAGPMDLAAAPLSMFTAITMLPARVPVCSPGEPSPYRACVDKGRSRSTRTREPGRSTTVARSDACPGCRSGRRRRLDFVAYGATQLGEALCCDVTLVSPLARRWPPATLLNHQGWCCPGRRRTPQARCLPRAPSARTAKAARARARDRRTMERRVAPPRRAARPFASLACSCSAPRSCHPGLVQAVVGPAQCGCAKHACCHFARDAASPRPHAWRAGAASAGRPARRVPACAQLPAGPLSRCSHVAQCRLACRCTGTACGSPEKSVEKKPFKCHDCVQSCTKSKKASRATSKKLLTHSFQLSIPEKRAKASRCVVQVFRGLPGMRAPLGNQLIARLTHRSAGKFVTWCAKFQCTRRHLQDQLCNCRVRVICWTC